MAGGTDITKVIIFIVTFALAFYVSFVGINYIWPNQKSLDSLTVIYPQGAPLSVQTNLATSDGFAEPFFKGNSGSLLFYVKLEPSQRTQDIQNPYSSIVSLARSFSFEIPVAPDAGFVNKSGQARLVVTNDKGIKEIIELAPLPLQQWVEVAILREGRRFDVVYNTKTVASQRLRNLPAIRKSTLLAGGQGLRGTIGLVRVASRRLTIGEIQYEYSKTSDTRGKPYLKPTLTTSIKEFCPPGEPCPSVNSEPSSPLLFWDSPYR